MSASDMLSAVQDGVMIAVHTRNDPSDAEWHGYVDLYRAHVHDIVAAVAYTRGGGPSAKQRAHFTAMVKEANHSARVAILVPSTPKKAIVTALGFLMASPIRAFDPNQRESAYDFMHLTSQQRDSVSAKLWHMCGELKIPLVTSQVPRAGG